MQLSFGDTSLKYIEYSVGEVLDLLLNKGS